MKASELAPPAYLLSLGAEDDLRLTVMAGYDLPGTWERRGTSVYWKGRQRTSTGDGTVVQGDASGGILEIHLLAPGSLEVESLVGDDFHRLVVARAVQGVGLVDLVDQACLCGAALLGGDGELRLRLRGQSDAEGWFSWGGWWRFQLQGVEPLRGEADQVGLAGPPSRRARALPGQGCREPERSTTRSCVRVGSAVGVSAGGLRQGTR